MPSVLLAGCGDIALRLASLLAGRFTLSGLRRDPSVLPSFIAPIAADVTRAATVMAALRGSRFDYAVITLTPGEMTELRYREVYVNGTANILAAMAQDTRVLFVSSTSVYGQDAGEWVDEDTPTGSPGFSGRLLAEAEQRVAASGLPATCIRCTGIYGPGRERMLRQVREGRINPAIAGQFSNRIHADDVARVIDFLISRWEQGDSPSARYIASDTSPTQLGEIWQWLAGQYGRELQLPAGWEHLPPTGKRCSSQRLQAQGFHWLYPDFRAGYASLLAGQ